MGLSGLNLTDWWHKTRLCLSSSDGRMRSGSVLSSSLKISLDLSIISAQNFYYLILFLLCVKHVFNKDSQLLTNYEVSTVSDSGEKKNLINFTMCAKPF